MCRRPKKAVFFLGLGRFWTFCPLRDLSPLQGALTGTALREGPLRPLRGGTVLTGRSGVPYRSFTEKDDEEAYGKAPYGEASYEKAPYELQESLREAMGRDFTRIGREFPLACRRPKKGCFFLGLGRFWTFCPLRDLSPLQGHLRDRLTGRPLTGRLFVGRLGPYRKPLTRRDGPYGKGRVPSQRRTTKRLTGRQGPYGKPLTRRDGPYEKGRSLMEGPGSLTGPSQRRTTKRLTGRQGPYGKPLGPYGQTDLRKGFLRGGFLQEGPLRGGFLREGP